MTTRLSWTTWPLLLGCICALPPLVAAGEPDAPSTPATVARAKNYEARNLARLAAGAQLEVQAPGTAVAAPDATAANALLRDEDPLGYALAAGRTSLVVSLPKIEVLNRFNFLNLTAQGKVAVAISSTKLPTDSPRWRSVQEMEFMGENGVVTCDLGSVEAKYVRISFEVPAEGRIDTFGLFGQRTLGDGFNARAWATKSKGGDVRYVLFNYAVDSPHAGVVLVSPGEDLDQAQQMADGDVGTSYTFRPSDPAPMAVIDLGSSQTLTRVGASFSAGPGHMDIYLVADPAQREGVAAKDNGKRAARTVEDIVKTDFPGDRQAVLAVETGKQPGLNRVGANVNNLSGRYLVMMFQPVGPLPAAGPADFKDFKDAADFKDVDGGHPNVSASEPPVGREPLQVAEITAYGNNPPAPNPIATIPLLPPGNPATPTGPITPVPPISPPGAGTITP